MQLKTDQFSRQLSGMQSTSDITVLAPQNSPCLEIFLSQTAQVTYVEPFSNELIIILGDLSRTILANPVLKHDAASVALAYWLRPANLKRLQQAFAVRLQSEVDIIYVPVGQVFHVAPSNVDTLFIYSWALSFLCGNINVVRISEKRSEIVTQLLSCLNLLMENKLVLSLRNRFVTYPHSQEITAYISSWCSHRVIWGGNETVENLRPVELNPHASERVFSSKFSYAILSTIAVDILGDEELEQLASRFFNDLFWFDQMACSSPQIIYWLGNSELPVPTIERFNHSLAIEVKKRGYQASVHNAVKRLNQAFRRSADEPTKVDLKHSGFISLFYGDDTIPDRNICGGGLLRHIPVTSIDEVSNFADRDDQTISYFGLTREERLQLAHQSGARGVDRIVPIGQALDFSPYWDGYDLISDFIRRVTIHL
jgi:hypothetical protein